MKKILFVFLLVLLIPSTNAIDCLGCHQAKQGDYPGIIQANFGMHIDINTTEGTGILTSDDCGECHYDFDFMEMMKPGFTVKTYTCEDCHINKKNKNAPEIYNHYNGANISVNANCTDCHNKSINLYKYNEVSSVSHYGIRPRINTKNGYCEYCHKNSSTEYLNLMQNKDHNDINTHTKAVMNPSHPATTPSCFQCHGKDIIHGNNLTIPLLTSDFCLNCHKNDVIEKNKHAEKVECKNCHTQKDTDIHTIKYILPDGIYRSINATSCNDCHDFSLASPFFRVPFRTADCTTCHQKRLEKFSDAPHIPTPINHSTNTYSGKLWNKNRYWNNTIENSSCYYCHGKEALHSSLGKLSVIKGKNKLNQDLTNGYWCANCHYAAAEDYSGDSYNPIPPEITNSTGLVPKIANDGKTKFHDHRNDLLTSYDDAKCKQCHNNALSKDAASYEFIHNLTPGGGGPDCALCHDTGGGAPEVNFTEFKKSVHANLNKDAINTTPLSQKQDKACWGCHGDGTQPKSHPNRYKNPMNCINNDCHTLKRSFKEPLIFSHFKDADKRENPENALSFNISTNVSCVVCHSNSLNYEIKNLNASVSHYASIKNLITSKNCIFCHLDKDNSRKWGNAIEINKNRTSMIELNRIRNKFTLSKGEILDIGEYKIKLEDISIKRESAFVKLYKGNKIVDSALINKGKYVYEERRIINNSYSKIPVLELNITDMFISNNESFIQFKGFRTKRVHSENKTTSCYKCHFKGSGERHKYKIIDIKNRYVYYTRVLFNSSDDEFDQSYALKVLNNTTPDDAFVSINRNPRVSIIEGTTWKLSENYSLTLEAIDRKSESARFLLKTYNKSLYDIVNKGKILKYDLNLNYLGYKSENYTIFKANVSEIMQGEPGLVVLENIYALSPYIQKVRNNTTMLGYNTSLFIINDTFFTGKIPNTLHSPLLFDGKNGGPNCVSCHIDKTELGSHINLNSANKNINRACWSCHGDGNPSKSHPLNYKNPRKCKSCHVYQDKPYYNATYIGDENHRFNKGCPNCHVKGHKILKYDVIPSISEVSITKDGDKIKIYAIARAGYNMSIRAGEYYIDTPTKVYSMSPIDGSFDEQKEELTAEFDISKLKPGVHRVYVKAMERDNKWSKPAYIEFIVKEKGIIISNNTKNIKDVPFINIGILVVIFVLLTIKVKNK